MRGRVLWSKKGEKVSVDLTTAPVRDGEQLVGAVLTFTDRRAYESLAAEKQAQELQRTEELARVRQGRRGRTRAAARGARGRVRRNT